MSKTTSVQGTEFKACNCGCGEPITSKANYKPGHDARHVGMEARRVAEYVTANKGSDLYDLGLYGLPSPALTEKAIRMAEKIVSRPEKAPRKPAKSKKGTKARPQAQSPSTGTVKIGRWEYPVRVTSAGKVERNTKRDESGSWEPVNANAAQNVVWS